jgi:hypothetical protein
MFFFKANLLSFGGLAADNLCNLSCQQFNRLSNFSVWQTANVNLCHEALVSKHFMLVQQFIDNLLRTPNKVRPMQAGILLIVASR